MRLVFVAPDGTETGADGVPGDRLLDAAQAAGQPLEGTCNGAIACGTCHVMLPETVMALLPPPSADEEDMLDLLPNATRRSRLSCQVRLTAALDDARVILPGS